MSTSPRNPTFPGTRPRPFQAPVTPLQALINTAQAGDVEALEEISRIARQCISALETAIANHRQEGADHLYELLDTSVKNFVSLCETKPEIFRNKARQAQDWPGIITRKSHRGLAACLELSEGIGFNLVGKCTSTDTPESTLAKNLLKHMMIMRQPNQTYQDHFVTPEQLQAIRKLPPLDRHTSAQWHESGLSIFLSFVSRYFGDEFEKHPIFARYQHPNHPTYKLHIGKAKSSRIRADIKKKLKQSWRSIAPR